MLVSILAIVSTTVSTLRRAIAVVWSKRLRLLLPKESKVIIAGHEIWIWIASSVLIQHWTES
jgi:hypothetical protein